jgi:hypothetical protein
MIADTKVNVKIAAEAPLNLRALIQIANSPRTGGDAADQVADYATGAHAFGNVE